MVGAAIGAIGVNLVFGHQDFDRINLATIIGAIIGSVLVLAVGTWVTDRLGLRQPAERSVADIIAEGESATVEFKSTARRNLHTGQRDDKIELVVAKTVAGFLNADGGLLVIGVDDDGNALGLDGDLSLMKAPDHDRYELWLTDYLKNTLGMPAMAFVQVSFEPYRGDYVVVVQVSPSDTPVFLDNPRGERTADFYARMGNSTRKLLTDDFADYARSRWK
jgi:predicted HTH transcriptional regulator